MHIQYNWISATPKDYEYEGTRDGVVIVHMTYYEKDFWRDYDGTKSPVTGLTGGDVDGKGGEQAFGFNLKNK